MTGTTLIDNRVREQVSDAKPDYRYLEAKMLTYLNEGLSDMWSRRSEFFYSESVLVAYPGDIASLGADLPISVHGYKAITDYVCYRIFQETSEDTDNAAKMMMHLNDYERVMAA